MMFPNICIVITFIQVILGNNFLKSGETNPNFGDSIVKLLDEINPDVIVYVYNDIEIEYLSYHIYTVQKPVYAVSTITPDAEILVQDEIVVDEENIFIVPLDNLNRFEETLLSITNLEFWKARYRLLFVVRNSVTDIERISHYFRTCKANWIINVAIIFEDNFETGYTFNPFTDNYLIETTFLQLFPDKTIDLHGFLLHIFMVDDNIYATKVGENKFIGKDGHISETVLEAMNAKYVYVSPKANHPFSTIPTSFQEGSTHISFNGIISGRSANKSVEEVYPNGRSDLIVLVPIPKRVYRNMYSEVSLTLFVTTLLISLLLFVYLRIATKKMNTTGTLLFVTAVVLGKTVREVPTKYFRMFFMSTMLIAFYLTANINSSITSVLTVPDTITGVRSLEELSKETGIKIKTRRGFSKRISVALRDDLWEGIAPNLELMEEPLDVDEVLKCTGSYYICRKEMAQYALAVNLLRNHTLCHRILDEAIVGILTNYAIPYGSPFLHRVGVLVKRIFESGFQEYWSRNVTLNFDPSKKRVEPSIISVDQIYPGIILFLVGQSVAAVAFVIEVIWYRLTRRCNLKLNYLTNIS